jgi:hypothetical protein
MENISSQIEIPEIENLDESEIDFLFVGEPELILEADVLWLLPLFDKPC